MKKINRAQFADELKELRSCIDTKSTEDSSHCFNFLEGTTIFVYKENCMASYQKKTGIYGAFVAKDVLKALDSIKSEDVEIGLDDRDNMVLTDGRTTVTISSYDDTDKASALYDSMLYDWEKVGEEFFRGLKLCAETASKDVKDGEISCVAIKSGSIEATDNMRASLFITKFKPKEDIYLPASVVKKVMGMNITHISVSDNMVHFNCSGFVYSIVTLGVEFPDIKGVVESWKPSNIKETTSIELPPELLKVTKEMIHFCGGDDFEKQVNIEYKKKDIVVSARKESASIIRKMENNTKTVGVKFTVSPVLLSSFLSENDSKVYIYDNKMFFIMPNFTHVIGM